jgi:hypothetical protein
VDVFSFAIIAWELLTKKRAYTHLYLTAEQIAAGVAEHGLRWPFDLRHLLLQSWNEKPEKRPSFAEIARRLEALKAAYSGTPLFDKQPRGGMRARKMPPRARSERVMPMPTRGRSASLGTSNPKIYPSFSLDEPAPKPRRGSAFLGMLREGLRNSK